MTTTLQPPSFALVHNAWSALRGERLGDRLVLRRLRGGSGECWWLELAAGARAQCHGLAGETVLTVAAGRLTCLVLGNELELPAGHFLVLPPHLPFEIRLGGRSPGSALIHCSSQLGASLPFEPL